MELTAALAKKLDFPRKMLLTKFIGPDVIRTAAPVQPCAGILEAFKCHTLQRRHHIPIDVKLNIPSNRVPDTPLELLADTSPAEQFDDVERVIAFLSSTFSLTPSAVLQEDGGSILKRFNVTVISGLRRSTRRRFERKR